MKSGVKTRSERCVRCRKAIGADHRFCPGCGMPRAGDAVLSTQISEIRGTRSQDEAPRHRRRKRDLLARALLLSAIALTVFSVVGVGLVLFSPDALEHFFPRGPTEERTPVAVDWQPEWVAIPAGEFEFGPPDIATPVAIEYPFFISRHEVTMRLWRDFLHANERELRADATWHEAYPGAMGDWRLDEKGRPQPNDPAMLILPVRGISANAAIRFCEWLTERLAQPGWEIRLPTDEEWEYVARGPEGRVYPWGDEFSIFGSGSGGSQGTPPGILGTVGPAPVRVVLYDKTPDHGVMGMGTNVREYVLKTIYEVIPADSPDMKEVYIPVGFAPYARGASYSTIDVERQKQNARTWNKNKLGLYDTPRDLGLRLVKVKSAGD